MSKQQAAQLLHELEELSIIVIVCNDDAIDEALEEVLEGEQ